MFAVPGQAEIRGKARQSLKKDIDWPSQPGLSTDQQKAELITLLERCVQLNLNAVLLQVRPDECLANNKRSINSV